MCILFIAVDAHPRYPLIVAANRDEYHSRPSAPMHRWPDQPGILAGRDRRAGGTWFGVNDKGRVAAVTNHRAAGHERAPAQARSRGELVARFLRNAESAADYGEFLRRDHRRFRPFNLIYGEGDRLRRFSSAAPRDRPLGGGFHSVSNGAPDDPWPKMSRGVSLLQGRISSRRQLAGEQLAGQLASVMKDRTTARAGLLPGTGPDLEREKHLSSIFIVGEHYGTRTTTLLLGAGRVFDLYEYNYRADGTEFDRRRYALDLRPPPAGKRRKIPAARREKA